MAGEVDESVASNLQLDLMNSGSVSFGRFERDELMWERRSSFSHNRYLAEVEKCSKPGSVVEKKAYFEAHFKRKGVLPGVIMVDQSSNDHLYGNGITDDFLDAVNFAAATDLRSKSVVSDDCREQFRDDTFRSSDEDGERLTAKISFASSSDVRAENAAQEQEENVHIRQKTEEPSPLDARVGTEKDDPGEIDADHFKSSPQNGDEPRNLGSKRVTASCCKSGSNAPNVLRKSKSAITRTPTEEPKKNISTRKDGSSSKLRNTKTEESRKNTAGPLFRKKSSGEPNSKEIKATLHQSGSRLHKQEAKPNRSSSRFIGDNTESKTQPEEKTRPKESLRMEEKIQISTTAGINKIRRSLNFKATPMASHQTSVPRENKKKVDSANAKPSSLQKNAGKAADTTDLPETRPRRSSSIAVARNGAIASRTVCPPRLKSSAANSRGTGKIIQTSQVLLD